MSVVPEAVLDHPRVDPYPRELADATHSSIKREQHYRLKRSRNGVVFRSTAITVYGVEDVCYLDIDSVGEAFAINQFDVHELVREIIDTTEYVLTYANEDLLTESQWRTVFGELLEYPGEETDD